MRKRNRIPFTKLEALGNDFVLIDSRTSSFSPAQEDIAALADRHRGIGFDQMLILRAPQQSSALCRVDIYNSDGSRAEQCGNGMRAVALWLHRSGEFDRTAMVETLAGDIHLNWNGRQHITATLPSPRFRPADCGLSDHAEFPVELKAGEQSFRVHGAALGNPHLVVLVDQPPSAELVESVGSLLSRHDQLANGANIGLACIDNEHRIDLRVFERGAGPTLACGSGACAAATILVRAGRVRSPVEVVQPGGSLVIDWTSEGQPVAMTGPANMVFEGVIPWAR